LIAVDWYIDQLRRKVNDSPAIDMTIPAEAYRGKKRQQLFFLSAENPEMPIRRAVDFMGKDNPRMDLFVDRSYGPSVQTMQVGVMRASEAMINEGKKQQAVQLVDTYFKKFPHMNFTFDRYTMFLLQNMIQAGGYQQAKPYIETLANETAERLDYYMYSMDPETLRKGFSDDFGTYRGIMEELKRIVASQKDQALIDKFNTMFSKFSNIKTPN